MYQTRIGHVKLRVTDLDRAVDFYSRFLNLRLVERVDDVHHAFLSGSASHHEIALESITPESPRTPSNATGVQHVAFEVPGKKSFARAYKALTEAGVHTRAVDNAISWSIYFEDPDGNALEIYWDTRHEPQGRKLWNGYRQPLDEQRILELLGEKEPYVVPPPANHEAM